MESGMDFFISIFPAFAGVLPQFVPASRGARENGLIKALAVWHEAAVTMLYTTILNGSVCL
jgi:hypothetical protein